MPKRAGTKRALVSRVKKAVKKSRRKLGAEKFERELTRTITFLANLQRKLTVTPKSTRATAGKSTAKGKAKPVRKPAAKPVRSAKATKRPVAAKK